MKTYSVFWHTGRGFFSGALVFVVAMAADARSSRGESAVDIPDSPSAISAQVDDEKIGRADAFEYAKRMTVAKVWTSPDGGALLYRRHVPAKPQAGKLYPLLVHMHGAGSRGSNNLNQIKTGGADFISWARKRGVEYIFLAPQCPKGKRWVDSPWDAKSSTMKETPTSYLRMAMEIIDDTIRRYPVDPERIYVMGISMGGYATWELLQRKPKLFAAALPCCGGGDTACAPQLVDISIWAFHGAKDKDVPVVRSRAMVKAIKAAGGTKIRYREYPDRGHNVWTPSFTDDTVFDWLWTQRKNGD